MLLTKSQEKITSRNKTFRYGSAFELECGATLQDIEITYTTYGKLNHQKNNVVWVFHALTGNADPLEWWPGLVGQHKFFNPEEHFVICANVLGSCYGSTGPLSDDENGRLYLNQFPLITIRDMVKAHMLLANHLNVEKIFLGTGGSLGGQQLLEWAAQEPKRFEHIVPVATNAVHSPWGKAFNEAQRMALMADKTYFNGSPEGGSKGLEAARAIAMLSYRTKKKYDETQQETESRIDNFKASRYQQYQGEKLRKRFNAHSYFCLSKAMDSHDLSRKRGSIDEVLRTITAKTLVIGVFSDLLFTSDEQRFLAEHIPKAELALIESDFGHDGFLVESDQLQFLIKEFLRK